jgi:signal transduction histidine kinase
VGPPTGDTAQPGSAAATGHGLKNLASRAYDRGGSFQLEPGTISGTVLSWSVPIVG